METQKSRLGIITGIHGQDARLLAALLLRQGIKVIGSTRNRNDVTAELDSRVEIVEADLRDLKSTEQLIGETEPDYCFHLAAHHHSSQALRGQSDDEYETFYQANTLTTLNLLRVISRHAPRCRLFYAGSCHMFGSPEKCPQDEDTPFLPNSFYGLTKVNSANLIRHFREHSGIFGATGILYNHESPYRSTDFIGGKIARSAADIKLGRQPHLVVGDLEAVADWGYAGDYVEAMWRMVNAETPRDYVIATGEGYTVKEFIQHAFAAADLEWEKFVSVDRRLIRPRNRVPYIGNPARIRGSLGWEPTVTFESLVKQMVLYHLGKIK